MMADEIKVQSSLYISKGKLRYNSLPPSFKADLDGSKGPRPGQVLARQTGTVITFGNDFGTPGMCRMMNLDATNFVTVGVYDGTNFFPLMELMPGETYVFRISRFLNQEFVGTGTGTSADTNQLMVVADSSDCEVIVDAFSK